MNDFRNFSPADSPGNICNNCDKNSIDGLKLLVEYNFYSQEKLVAKILNWYLTNNKTENKKQPVHRNAKIPMQITAVSYSKPQ